MFIEAQNYAKPKTFLDTYKMRIEPWLKKIDIFIKCSDYPLSISEISKILCISELEIEEIAALNKLIKLDKSAFFKIMEHGSSEICKLYQREVGSMSPFVYSVDNISYIYNLCRDEVDSAFKTLRIKEATAYNLQVIFSCIPDCSA